jgi:hypothetical protein
LLPSFVAVGQHFSLQQQLEVPVSTTIALLLVNPVSTGSQIRKSKDVTQHNWTTCPWNEGYVLVLKIPWRGTHRLKSWAAARDGQVMFDVKWMNPASGRDRTLAVAIRPNKFNALRRGVRTSFPPLPSFCTTETPFEHQSKASEHETQREWWYLLDSSACQWTNNNSSRNPMTPKTS